VKADRRWIREGPIYYVNNSTKKKERGLAILCNDILLYTNQKKNIDERIPLDDDVDLESNDPMNNGSVQIRKPWISFLSFVSNSCFLVDIEKLRAILDIYSDHDRRKVFVGRRYQKRSSTKLYAVINRPLPIFI